jgi:phenylacetate-CoA ligase
MAGSNNLFELSVIVPCFNEEKNIADIVSKILDLFDKHAIRGEIVLINDGSWDRTNVEIERLSSQFKNVLGINHSKNLGIAEAWNTGLKNCRGKYVVTIDADLQYKPEDIIVLYEHMQKDNYDLVQGWRKEYKDKNLFRECLSRGLDYMLNILFFTRINDIKSGFVISTKEVFSDILRERNKFRLFQHFFILAALKKGYRLKQIPITFYPRTKGESFIRHPIIFSCKVISDIPRAILEFWHFNYKKKRDGYKCVA